jgi:hypothetical protein
MPGINRLRGTDQRAEARTPASKRDLWHDMSVEMSL